MYLHNYHFVHYLQAYFSIKNSSFVSVSDNPSSESWRFDDFHNDEGIGQNDDEIWHQISQDEFAPDHIIGGIIGVISHSRSHNDGFIGLRIHGSSYLNRSCVMIDEIIKDAVRWFAK